MKKYVIAAMAALIAGYFGYDYVTNHYIILSMEDVSNLKQAIDMLQQQAYEVGKLACNKST